MAAALTLGMAACSDDISNSGGNGGVLEADEVRYLQVAISDAHAGTRAASFDPGTAAENKVGDLYMMFYDQAGNVIYRADGKDIVWNPANDNPGTAGNVEKKGTATVKVTLKKNQNLPAYVVCFINPVQWDLTDVPHNMQDLRDKKRENYKDGNGNYAMSNSSYFGTNILTGETDVKISGTPIPQDYLLKKMPDGTEPEGTVKTLDIYVERYAAKVQFTMETRDGDGTGEDEKGVFPLTITTKISDDETVTYTLKFKPKAWTINADAPTMYAIKKFALTDDGPVPTLDQVKTYMSGWNNADGTPMWNDATNFRSYWSCSPAFFATDFPQVSDQIADKVADGTGAGVAIEPYGLKYYSYNQIAGPGGIGNKSFATTGADGGTWPTMYALENTVGREAVKSLNPKAAVPSVLVVGEYNITAGTTPVAEGTSFYMRDGHLYFKDAPGAEVSAVLIKDKLIEDQQILYVKTGNTYTLLNGTNAGTANKSKLVVKHPDPVIRGENLVPHRYVTLQLSDVTGTDLYYRPNGAGAYTPVTATNINAVNTLLWQQVGVAEAYTNGKCYYSIPIHHLRMSEDATGKPIKAGGSIDWDNLRVGDMGLVRNHVYKISVKAIKGMATGIDNLNYPIVPPMDADDYYVKYQINILGWRVVPTQENIIL